MHHLSLVCCNICFRTLPDLPVSGHLPHCSMPLSACICCRTFVANMWQQQQKHECAMTTVSDIMQDHGLSRIDLLKIDVERAELDVLMGISHTDWKLISQAVLEVHDVQGRLQHVLHLLKDTAGFASVFVTQDEALKGSTLYNIYCSRTTNGSTHKRNTNFIIHA